MIQFVSRKLLNSGGIGSTGEARMKAFIRLELSSLPTSKSVHFLKYQNVFALALIF